MLCSVGFVSPWLCLEAIYMWPYFIRRKWWYCLAYLCIHGQWLNYSSKGGGSLFSGETATWLEICIRVYQLVETFYACILHSLKYHIIKNVKQKNDLVPLGACNGYMISACCWALKLEPPDCQNPVLDSGGSQQKGAGSVFQGGGSQITGGGSKSWGGGADMRRNPPV